MDNDTDVTPPDPIFPVIPPSPIVTRSRVVHLSDNPFASLIDSDDDSETEIVFENVEALLQTTVLFAETQDSDTTSTTSTYTNDDNMVTKATTKEYLTGPDTTVIASPDL